MSAASATFPEDFRDLEPLASWALPTERARNAMRRRATAEELRGFYDLMEPRLRGVIAYLEGFPLEDLKGPAQCLFWLSLSMAEVAFAVEKYDAVGRVPYAIDLEQMIPLHDF